MDKIKLTDNARRILLELRKDEWFVYEDSDEKDLEYLEKEGLINAPETKDETYSLSEYGIEYLRKNPKLKNPSIWDDKKYWITTSIAILALLASVGSMIFNIATRSCTCCG